MKRRLIVSFLAALTLTGLVAAPAAASGAPPPSPLDCC